MDPKLLHQPGKYPHFVSFKAVVTSCDAGCWIRFMVVRNIDMMSDFLEHGLLKIGSERANFLQLQVGARFTAYKVLPQLGCDQNGMNIIIVDLTGGYHKGQILRSPVGTKNPINIDICSGMGGWHVGAQFLGIKFAIHIEQDVAIAEVGAHVTLTRIVDPEWVVRCGYDNWKHLLDCGVTLVSAFQNDQCWEMMASQGVEMIAASLPCPPWSSLTPQIGLGSASGQLFRDLANLADGFQPRMVVLENVEGLIMHDHWKLIVEWFVEVGFVVAHESIDHLHCVCPMFRNRASVIIINMHFRHEFEKHSLADVPVALHPLIQSPSAMRAGAILQSIPQVLNDFALIDTHTKDLLCKLEFWPRNWKCDESMIDGQTISLEARLTTVTRPLPCVVARYGFPEELNPQSLREKGLIMQLVQHPDLQGQPRWITPVEHLAAMGWPIMKIFVPRVPKLARLVVGNTIAPIHALVSLARAAILRPSLVPIHKRGLNLFNLMIPLLNQIPKLHRCDIHFDDDFIWVEQQVTVPRHVTEIQDDNSDGEVETFSNHGVVEYSPDSVPMTAIDTQQSQGDGSELTVTDRQLQSLKKRVQQFPIFVTHQKRLCAVKPPQKVDQCQLANSTPSNVVRVCDTPDDHRDCKFAWFPNETFTPHVLHEITHADGVKHDVLLPDTWITGTVNRGIECKVPMNTSCLYISDLTGTWNAQVTLTSPVTAIQAIHQVLPSFSRDWVQKLMLNQKTCDWDTLCLGGTLTIVPFKFKRILLVPELKKVINLFCDAFDTPEQVNDEHPLLKRLGSAIDWIHIDLSCSQAVRMEPNALILDFPHHCWTLHSVSWVPSRPLPIRVVKAIQPDGGSQLPPIGRAMCIHPFTGKSAEFALAEVTHVCDILDKMNPPVPSEITIVAEINSKRIDLTTLLSDLDLRQVIRFRHYGLPGGAPSMNLVRTELMAHGVPEDQVTTRAKAVITALGEPIVQDIFQKHDPWARGQP